MTGNPDRIPTLRPDLPALWVTSRSMWREWLDANHATSAGVWAVTIKKAALASGAEHVSAVDLNEECLCFGWIDSKPRRVDEHHTALLCTPRKAGSGWSKVNKDRLQPLLQAGRVATAGLEAIRAAQADGSWTRLDQASALLIPADLAEAFQRYPTSAVNFEQFPPSARRGILEWIALAKTDGTRTKRINETAQKAQLNQRANQWRSQRPAE